MSPAVHGDVRECRTPDAAPERVSAGLDRWLRADPDPTLGGFIVVFGHKSFAIVFVLLLGVPGLPLPTGGATHLLELVAIVLALEIVAGRKEIWLPRRWAGLRLGGPATPPATKNGTPERSTAAISSVLVTGHARQSRRASAVSQTDARAEP